MDLTKEERDAFALQYKRLVHKVSNSLARRYRHIAVEDFESYAWIGLLELIDRFDPDKGFTFLTYAWDSLFWLTRKALSESDWHTRHIRYKYGDTLPIVERWAPDKLESLPKFYEHNWHFESESDRRVDLRQFINIAIASYSERRQAIFRAYFGDDRTMTEVGREFGVTKQAIQNCVKEMIATCQELAAKEEIDIFDDSKTDGSGRRYRGNTVRDVPLVGSRGSGVSERWRRGGRTD